jgi:hypothetical protein
MAQSAAQARQQAALAQQRSDLAGEEAGAQAAQAARAVRATAWAAAAKAARQEQHAADEQRAARAQSAEQAALDNARIETAARAAREAADVAASESVAAQNQRRSALFVQFQTKAVDPHDRVAALLNYTTYGANSGTATCFWAKKEGSRSVYVEYKEGSALAEPVVSAREIDAAKIDASDFFVKASGSGVSVVMHDKVFAECASCDRASVQSRWIDFFTGAQK